MTTPGFYLRLLRRFGHHQYQLCDHLVLFFLFHMIFQQKASDLKSQGFPYFLQTPKIGQVALVWE